MLLLLNRQMKALRIIAALGASTLCAKADSPCPGRSFPVVVVDVDKGQAGEPVIACEDAVTAFLKTPTDEVHHTYNLAALDALPKRPQFLRDGRPVKIYVVNRKMLTVYSASLNSTYALSGPTVDVRGVTPPAGIGSTPGTKGFVSQAATNNLLTTDQAVALMLNDETFDRPFNRVADDAAAVLAQADQITQNIQILTDRITAIQGTSSQAKSETPVDIGTVRSVAGSWALLDNEIVTASAIGVDESIFANWISRADRLLTEMTRVNTKLTAFPFADFYTNLRASITVLKDSQRAVLEERDAIDRAQAILQDALNYTGNAPTTAGSLVERQRLELRNALRARYSTATVSDATLARIVQDTDGRARLRSNLNTIAVGGPIFRRYANNLTQVQQLFDDTGQFQRGALPDMAPLYTEIANLNAAEGQALRRLNLVYDTYRAPVEPLPNLNLAGASGNVHVNYSVIPVEQYHRYQIVNEVLAPLSNCAQSNSASTSTSGGFAPCTTAPATAPPGPSATYSITAPAQTGSTTTVGVVAGAAPPSPLPTITKEFDLHHFTDGALMAGVAYDSVPNQSYQWQQCPTSSSFPNGTTSTPCYSPTPPSGSSTPTYNYQLLRTTQAPVAAIGGILLYLKQRDMFSPKTDKSALAAMFAVSLYPLNHYYLGPAYEFKPGISVSSGIVFGSTNVLPSRYGFVPGDVTTSAPPPPSVTRFKTGFYLTLNFDAYLFKAIFTSGPVVPTIGSSASAVSATPTTAATSH
jgi:hypothetical protein